MNRMQINQIVTQINDNHKLINVVKEKFLNVSMVVCMRGWERFSEVLSDVLTIYV